MPKPSSTHVVFAADPAPAAATMRVTPAEGRRVLDPETRQPLPAGGADVPLSTYWLRRVADGDVVAASAPIDTPINPASKDA